MPTPRPTSPTAPSAIIHAGLRGAAGGTPFCVLPHALEAPTGSLVSRARGTSEGLGGSVTAGDEGAEILCEDESLPERLGSERTSSVGPSGLSVTPEMSENDAYAARAVGCARSTVAIEAASPRTASPP
jgi:hypothetical protein